jgi:uncharacterized protein YndB with AHSA1/START domain
MTSTDRIKVSTFVAVAPADAFEIFTQDIDRWWRRAPRFRDKPDAGVIRFEGTPERRLVEADASGACFEIGRVRIWEPGKRLVFGWRNRQFAEAESSEVEVRFDPTPGGTTIALEHRGLTALPKGHPLRGGLDGEAFEAFVGYYWAELLTTFRARCSGLID